MQFGLKIAFDKNGLNWWPLHNTEAQGTKCYGGGIIQHAIFHTFGLDKKGRRRIMLNILFTLSNTRAWTLTMIFICMYLGFEKAGGNDLAAVSWTKNSCWNETWPGQLGMSQGISDNRKAQCQPMNVVWQNRILAFMPLLLTTKLSHRKRPLTILKSSVVNNV